MPSRVQAALEIASSGAGGGLQRSAVVMARGESESESESESEAEAEVEAVLGGLEPVGVIAAESAHSHRPALVSSSQSGSSGCTAKNSWTRKWANSGTMVLLFVMVTSGPEE